MKRSTSSSSRICAVCRRKFASLKECIDHETLCRPPAKIKKISRLPISGYFPSFSTQTHHPSPYYSTAPSHPIHLQPSTSSSLENTTSHSSGEGLTSTITLRQNGFSLVYLFFLLCSPLIPVPSVKTMAGSVGHFQRAILVLTSMILLAVLAFQLVLVFAFPPYGRLVEPKCDLVERIFRHVGLIRLDNLDPVSYVRYLGPEVVVLLTTSVVRWLCGKLHPRPALASELLLPLSQPSPLPGAANPAAPPTSAPDLASSDTALAQRRSALFTILGKYICLGLMCLAGSLRPSLLSLIYYLAFVGLTTAWVCSREGGGLSGRGFAWVCRLLSLLLNVHITLLFLYQLQWLQEQIPPASPIARYLGLTALLVTGCDGDPRVSSLSSVEWASFLNPFILILLYFALCFESDAILNAPVILLKESGMSRQLSTRLSQRGKLLRNQTNRWRSATRKVRELPADSAHKHLSSEALTESTPMSSPKRSESHRLIRGRESAYRRTPPRRGLVQDGRGSVTVTELSDEESKPQSPDADNLVNEAGGERIPLEDRNSGTSTEKLPRPIVQKGSGILDIMFNAGITIAQLLAQSSYIGTSIIMMAWSITYHSWLTFVLLLWASVMWLVPNQRRAMLQSSPFLVVYAVFLLLAQYIYGMDLTDSELPQTVQGLNLKQIGFEKVIHLPCRPILIKTCFTLMFWITLKQYIVEKREQRSQSTMADIAAPLQIGVGFTSTGLSEEPGGPQTNQLVQKIGRHVRALLTKFWIWIVASILFTIGISGERMTIFRIIYMALSLIFILTFQISWTLWRKIMYGFWLTVIIYSMLILVMTYTYQFDNFDNFWEEYLHIDKDLQKDIGLERYDTGNLFVMLLTPTFFVIITVVQLYYFHKDFLAISDIKSRGTSSVRRARRGTLSDTVSGGPGGGGVEADDEGDSGAAPSSRPDDGYAPFDRPKRDLPLREILRRLTWKTASKYLLKKLLSFVELFWLFLELHMLKIVLFTIMVVAVSDVCALHLLLVTMTIISLMFGTNLQIVIVHAMSFFSSVVLLAKMIYQIDYIDHSHFNVSCDGENKTYNTAEWVGFVKANSGYSLPHLLQGYIAIILMVTFHAVVMTRQKYQRHLRGRSLSRPLTMFPGITFVHADKNIRSCLKYLANYVFYRFGIEICLISVVGLIATRMDIYACVYSLWVTVLISPRRALLSTLWPILTLFVAITLTLEYSMVVGLPPFLCITYPWAGESEMLQNLREWLYLPDENTPPSAYKLICDFVVYLLVCRQGVVFRIERKHIDGSYPGGTNRTIINEAEQENFVNPTLDFISYTRSYLDVVKRIVLQMFLWVTLAIVFLAGSNRVNIFSLGYLIGAFIFLWQGNDLYLRPVSTILRWWHFLISYNVSVIFLKTILQMAGCLFMDVLTTKACWMVQLFGVACIKKFGIPAAPKGAFDPDECEVYYGDVGLGWDGVCFAFLILQRRLFNSYYFFHVIDEAKAMSILASRGAELIEELSEKRIEEQREAERRILEKIKNKMDRIKASQKKLQGPNYKEPDSHYVETTSGVDGGTHRRKKRSLQPTRNWDWKAIRSGDYYMFDDLDEEIVDDLGGSLSSAEDSDEAVDKQRQPISDLISNLLKGTSLGKVAEEALAQDERARAAGGPRRSSMPPQPYYGVGSGGAPWLRKRAISLPDSPQKLAKIQEGPEPLPGTSQDERDRSDDSGSQKKTIKFDEDDGKPPGDTLPEEEKPTSARVKIMNFLKFLIALLISLMVTLTIWLNKFSRDYRFVMKTLSIEKKQLKGTKNFGCGVRRGSNQMWEPLPVALAAKAKSSPMVSEESISKEDSTSSQDSVQRMSLTDVESPMSIRDFEGSDEMDTRSQPAFIRLLMAVWYALFSHSELLCYFIIFLHQIRSPTILSLPLPLMVFLWGTLSVPRPSKTFWVTIIAYTEVVVVIKCVCQFELIPWNSKLIPDNAPFALPRIIGVERQPGMYAYYDLLLLLVVFFHRSMLKSLGLWKVSAYSSGAKSSPSSELTELRDDSLSTAEEGGGRGGSGGSAPGGGAPGPLQRTGSARDSVSLSELSAAKESLLTEELEGKGREDLPIKLKSKKLFWPVVKFFHFLMRRSGKVTDDVYAYMFFCDFFNILVVILGFASFGSSQGDGGVSQYFEENKVPVPFLVMLILQFGLIIVDRTLYLRKFILGKILFQLILVIGIHVWMFFVLPAVTQRSFNAALSPQMWYMVKCIYLLLSAYQIRVGYPTRILGNFLCKSYNYINMILFKVFMFVPFVFELRALMDWIWTDTSMTLSDWLKMEDIFAHVFQLKCQRRAENEYPQARGEKKAKLGKYLLGGGCLMMIIAVIWFPLVLFALGNTVGEPNLPYEITVTVQISSFIPIYKYSVQNDSIASISASEWEKFGEAYKKSRTAQTFLSNYEAEDVGVVTLMEHSESVWTMSPPAIATLQQQLESKEAVHMRFAWKMSRLTSNPQEQPPFAEDGVDIWLPEGDPARQALLAGLAMNATTPIPIHNIMPKFIKVTSRGTAAPIDQLMIYDDSVSFKNKYRDISVLGGVSQGGFWSIAEQCSDTTYENLLKFLPRNTCDKKIILYTFNDKAFPASLNIISGKGIIGLYTTFVIVIHSVIRGFFTGISFKIMFDDMPNVDRLLQLCLDIYLVRESGDLDLEEDLFAKLVFLYRSPETLIKWTRPPEEIADDQPDLD